MAAQRPRPFGERCEPPPSAVVAQSDRHAPQPGCSAVLMSWCVPLNVCIAMRPAVNPIAELRGASLPLAGRTGARFLLGDDNNARRIGPACVVFRR